MHVTCTYLAYNSTCHMLERAVVLNFYSVYVIYSMVVWFVIYMTALRSFANTYQNFVQADIQKFNCKSGSFATSLAIA